MYRATLKQTATFQANALATVTSFAAHPAGQTSSTTAAPVHNPRIESIRSRRSNAPGVALSHSTVSHPFADAGARPDTCVYAPEFTPPRSWHGRPAWLPSRCRRAVRLGRSRRGDQKLRPKLATRPVPMVPAWRATGRGCRGRPRRQADGQGPVSVTGGPRLPSPMATTSARSGANRGRPRA